MNYNICPECKTPNEPEYQYCKNCGAPVQRHGGAGPDFAQSGAPNSQNYNQTTPHQADAGTSHNSFLIDGVPEDKLITYIGKNSYKIIGKFIKLESTGSKVCWCWPPFLWGFFLGPIGVMIWFLYRKMYKSGCIAGVIGVAFATIKMIIFNALNFGNIVTDNYDEFIENNSTYVSFSSINMLIKIMVAILAGIFCMYLYKNYVIKSIKNFKPLSNEPGYLTYGLASVGGTSAGAAILGVLAVSVASGVISNMIQLAVNLIRS